MSELVNLHLQARELDQTDPAPMRDRFELVAGRDGMDVSYLAGNSLGLLPSSTRAAINAQLDAWSRRGVAGFFEGPSPWQDLAGSLSEPMARIVGAQTNEVVVMNTLTVNLHLLMTALFRPEGRRSKIVIERGAFPSDDYAVASHLRQRGLDPERDLHRLRSDELGLFTTDGIVAELDAIGEEVALVLLPTINFRTGQLLDVERITAAAHNVGARIIWDLAHSAGNVVTKLHEWNVDGAAWCTYKYLNSGPGGVGAAFIHERHLGSPALHGWWGNDPATRFEMAPNFRPDPSALGWQISTPPVLSLTALGSSLQIFDDAGGMNVLQERSRRLTAFLESVFDVIAKTRRMEQLTSRSPDERGAQLSILVDDAAAVTEVLTQRHGVVPDERPPNIIRFAPVPLSSTYEECWRAGVALFDVLPAR